MAQNTVKLLLNNFPRFRESLNHLESDVLVGVPMEAPTRKAVEGEKSAMNNATLAYIHDNGSPAANIPARPFMRPGIESVKERISVSLEKGARAVIRNEPDGIEKALHIAGLTAQSAIRGKLNQGIEPALSERTLAARRARGRQGTKPLIDTGQLRNSINYVIRPK